MKAGWEESKIEELCFIGDGNHSSNYPTKEEMIADGVPFIRSTNIGNGIVTNFDIKFISKEKHIKLKKGHLKTGDVLITNRGEIGKTAIVDSRFDGANLNSQIAWLRCNESIFNRYLFYFLNSNIVQQHFKNSKSGAAVQQFTIKQIKELKIAHPNYVEQQRIVAILDQAFEGIAKARANAQQNLQNARALFESYLQSVFSVRGELVEPQHPSTSSGRADKGWANNNLVALSDLATDITDGDHMPPPKAITGVPFITIGNIVKPTRTIDFTDTFKVPFEYFNKLKANKKPKRGNVLYTVTGSFGIPVLVKDNQEFCFQRHIGLIRPKSDVSSEWLCYLLGSPQLVKQANDGATGTAQKTVSLKVLRGFQVPNLPIDKQNKMVVELDALSKETQRLEAIYQRKIALLDELKKSLLQQAFAGEL